MDTYTLLRHFADSWMLAFMTLFFVGVVVWTLRPSARSVQNDAANIPFRNDDLPQEKERTDGRA
jgi:cytochrome c oxidase cbb3-type subunit 4